MIRETCVSGRCDKVATKYFKLVRHDGLLTPVYRAMCDRHDFGPHASSGWFRVDISPGEYAMDRVLTGLARATNGNL